MVVLFVLFILSRNLINFLNLRCVIILIGQRMFH